MRLKILENIDLLENCFKQIFNQFLIVAEVFASTVYFLNNLLNSVLKNIYVNILLIS